MHIKKKEEWKEWIVPLFFFYASVAADGCMTLLYGRPEEEANVLVTHLSLPFCWSVFVVSIAQAIIITLFVIWFYDSMDLFVFTVLIGLTVEHIRAALLWIEWLWIVRSTLFVVLVLGLILDSLGINIQ